MTPARTDKLVLTGAAGLVGQNLVVELKAQGYVNLVAIDKHAHNLAILRELHPDVQTIEADLAEPGAWADSFAGAACIVQLHAQITGKFPEEFVRNNEQATRLVLAATQQHGVPYLVHISSSVVNSVADDDYTNTKKAQEKLVVDSGLAHCVLRPTLMFGWFDPKHLGWLSRFMRRVPVFPIPGHGRYMRQPLYAGDFATIIASCLRSRISGQRYNITGLEKVDYVDIIRQIKRSTGARAMVLHIPYTLFHLLLRTWALFDRDPPFTAAQLQALVAHDEFEVIDWPSIFGVQPTPFAQAIDATFNDPEYGDIALEF